MRAKIRKWGNSIALRIPKTLAEDAKLRQDSVVSLSLDKGSLIVTPVSEPVYDLDKLLSGISDINLHSETDTGDKRGKEIW